MEIDPQNKQSTQKCKTARDLVEFAVSLISLMFQ